MLLFLPHFYINIHNHMNNIEHKEPQIHVNDLHNDFKHKMDNINDLRRMQ